MTAGADVVHTTINAVGERTGNADLAQVAAALEMLYGIKLNIKYDKLYELSKLFEKFSGVTLPPHYPLVGDDIYATESGIVAGWIEEVQKNNMPLIVFPVHWKLTGRKGVKVGIGTKSGGPSIEYKAKELGIEVPKEKINEILIDVKEQAIKLKRLLTDEEFKEIIKRHK